MFPSRRKKKKGKRSDQANSQMKKNKWLIKKNFFSTSLESKTKIRDFPPYLIGKVSFLFFLPLASSCFSLSFLMMILIVERPGKGHSHTQLVVLWIGTAYLEGNLADWTQNLQTSMFFDPALLGIFPTEIIRNEHRMNNSSLAFTWCSLCARQYAKNLTLYSLSLCSNIWWVLLCLFFRWENWGSKRCSKLFKFKQLVNDRLGDGPWPLTLKTTLWTTLLYTLWKTM